MPSSKNKQTDIGKGRLAEKKEPIATTTTTTTTTTMSNGLSQKEKRSSMEQEQDLDPDEPVYFWRPHERNGYLGQWYPTPFQVHGEMYATAEMWMMVQKARLFKDEKTAKQMLETNDPKIHKLLGRKVRNFDQAVWNQQKLAIVSQGNYHKFTCSQDAVNLQTELLATGVRELVEASPLDRIWGIGYAEEEGRRSREKWGQNLLGIALMEVRERLREEEKEREKGKGKGKG